MRSNRSGELERAKNYAFLLFKFRPRSEYELRERLKKKKFEANTVKETLSFLSEKRFLDDESFCRAWICSRLKKPFGLRRIRQELKLKGIDQEIIDTQIASAKEGYSEDNTINKIAKEKFAKAKNTAPDTAKRRIFAYLVRRGFSPAAVAEVIKEL